MKKIKVVLIDDEYFFRQSMIKNLKESVQGCEIEVVGDTGNGEDGLALIMQKKPDISFVDINMPLMSGLELLKILRSKEINCEIVIISGYASFEYAKQAIELDVSNYLLKPVKKVELQLCLEKAIQKIEEKSRHATSQFLESTICNRYSAITNQVLNYINQNLTDTDLSVSCIAATLHSNYGHICTSFKSDTNKTINQYITQARMDLAKQHFLTGHRNISLVSKMVGYDDASYFGKCFKKSFSLGPSAYIITLESAPDFE